MPAEGAEMRAEELPHITADILARLRVRAPRVHCITNSVAQAFTANTLLAVGAIPSMTLAVDEIGAFVARADALLVNLGTFDEERRAAEVAATAAALLCSGVAGGIAGERASGRGSFPAALLDALYALDQHTLTEKARVT